MTTQRARSFRPLSEIPREDVDRYLQAQGHLTTTIAWKYFDDAFNVGRERGLVWMHKDTVSGFLGVLPFPLGIGGVRHDAVWSFDWSLAAPKGAPGMGVMLLRDAINRWEVIHSLGGNANTTSLLPRIAQFVDEDAAMTVMRPLRSGYWLDRARQRFPSAPMPRLLDGLPVPLRHASGVRIVDGVSADLTPLLDAELRKTAGGKPARPAYDMAYLEWLIGRCPLLESWTAMASAGDAGAIMWRLRELPNVEWRVALWNLPGATRSAGTVLDGCAVYARAAGGTHLAAMVAMNDDERRNTLATAGFSPRRGRHPLYISTKSASQPHGAMTALSYLDTDMAYIR
jgi:hypothetical protein